MDFDVTMNLTGWSWWGYKLAEVEWFHWVNYTSLMVQGNDFYATLAISTLAYGGTIFKE